MRRVLRLTSALLIIVVGAVSLTRVAGSWRAKPPILHYNIVNEPEFYAIDVTSGIRWQTPLILRVTGAGWWSPDGKKILMSDRSRYVASSNQLVVGNVITGERWHLESQGTHWVHGWSDDSRYIAYDPVRDGHNLVIADTETQSLYHFEGALNGYADVTFYPKSSCVLIGKIVDEAIVFETVGPPLCEETFSLGLPSTVFSADSSVTGIIKLSIRQNGIVLHLALEESNLEVFRVSLAPSGIASVDYVEAGTIAWNVSPSGRYFWSFGQLLPPHIIDLETGAAVVEFSEITSSVSWSADEATAVLNSGQRGPLHIIDLETGTVRRSHDSCLPYAADISGTVQLSPDEQWIVYAARPCGTSGWSNLALVDVERGLFTQWLTDDAIQTFAWQR